ncbi:hypothetical protein GCM10027348_39340 [Hymenobacter tenuis]
MPPKTYKVLWIDDECDTWGVDLQGDALDNEIILKGFTSVEAGFEHLREDLSRYDAILLDVISFEKKEQKKGTESETALDQARDHIMSLKHEKVFPFFVLTGQKTKQDDKSFVQRYEGKLYKKGSTEDKAKLFAAIKLAVDEQPEAQLRERHAQAFAACTEQLLGEAAGRLLVKVLLDVEKSKSNHDDDAQFNNLRQLVEAFLYAAHRHQLLPTQCLKAGQVNLTSSSIFFSGRQVDPPQGGDSIKMLRPILPAVLAQSLRALIDLTNNGSHYQQSQQITQIDRETTRKKLQELREQVKTPYLLASLTYQLLDLLVWMKNILADTQVLSQLQNSWEIISPSTGGYISGTISHLFTTGGGVFKSADSEESFMGKTVMSARVLQVGDSIEVILKPSSRAGGRYAKEVANLK